MKMVGKNRTKVRLKIVKCIYVKIIRLKFDYKNG